jgi:hypothetical protein
MKPLGFIPDSSPYASVMHGVRESRLVGSRVEREEMVYRLTPERNSYQRSEPQRAVVEDAQAHLVESVVRLSRECRPGILPEKAREELLALRPHLQEALEALEDLEGRTRSLTDQECSRQHAFQMLLALAKGGQS